MGHLSSSGDVADAPGGPGGLLERTETIRVRVAARHAAREAAIQDSREAIRAAANAIRAVHRGEWDRGDGLIGDARSALARAVGGLADEPDLLHAGFVHDAAKEVAEAVLTRAAVGSAAVGDAAVGGEALDGAGAGGGPGVAGESVGADLPGPEAVGVDDTAWLHGLAETVGELRRACLDHVRAGRLAQGEVLLDLMQEILSVLVTIDAPDGVTKGLRRSTDAARAITERTRGDLTTAASQQRLQDALNAHREAMERAQGE